MFFNFTQPASNFYEDIFFSYLYNVPFWT